MWFDDSDFYLGPADIALSLISMKKGTMDFEEKTFEEMKEWLEWRITEGWQKQPEGMEIHFPDAFLDYEVREFCERILAIVKK